MKLKNTIIAFKRGIQLEFSGFDINLVFFLM